MAEIITRYIMQLGSHCVVAAESGRGMAAGSRHHGIGGAVKRLLLLGFLSVATASHALAATYRVEPIKEPLPKDAVSQEIGKLLSPMGVKVIRGKSRTICEIWLVKKLELAASKAKEDAIYALAPGQLVGAIRFPRKGSDVRDQAIDKGVYTLRYAYIPVDGDHQGMSPTPDFLLIAPAGEDKSPKRLDMEKLIELSSGAVGTSHPGTFRLMPANGPGKGPAIRHDEEKDWWIVRLPAKATLGSTKKDVFIELVVVGFAEE